MSRFLDVVRRPTARAVGSLPEPVQMILNPRKYGFRRSDVPCPVSAPTHDRRLYIAPVNFAGQAYRWARAVETLPRVGAVNMQYRRTEGDYGFPADYELPAIVFARSRGWADRQFRAVKAGFTHVLIEAERPIFGSLFGGDVRAETEALIEAGLRVGMIVHGSDVRLPSRHRQLTEWSPFEGNEWELTPRLQETAERNIALLRDLALPTFVSTATLREYVPAATWLPLVIDPAAWATDEPPLVRQVPVVVHIPSSGVVKGTSFVRAAVAPLIEEGLIEYREASHVPASQMPALYRGADIVIDALRMGNYGVAACEAMAAGRLTMVYLTDEAVEEAIEEGAIPPVVISTPDTLEADLRAALADRERFQALAAEGPAFVREVHDGRRSAATLRSFLDVSDPTEINA